MFTFMGSVHDEITGMSSGTSSGAAANAVGVNSRMRELEEQLARLQMLNQALWETVSEKLNVTEEEFLAKVKEVDLRDGQEDGKMGTLALKCPKCQRVSSSKHWRCLYCSAKFKRPTMA